ncbi:MAG: NCS2 family permease [Oculatellaceae cyanobacterium Prado106]|jgi:AGZA family xanthine/uracil permease-like MFS transporter|nr:NCS2 family permease [Oculatellaceae cyanobacterium Prado106]
MTLQPSTYLDRIALFFRFHQLGTNYRTELLASVTIFMATAPVLVVVAHVLSNAVFLSQPGDLFSQLLVSVALCSAIASLLMGLLANYPFVVGVGAGTSALFAFSIVLGMGMDWRLALAAVLVEGILFTALSASSLRRQLTDAIPASLKQAMVVGLGLFLSYIALSGKVDSPSMGAGIIVASASMTTAFGSLREPVTLIAIAGILFTAVLTVRRMQGALLLGILATAGVGWMYGVAPFPQDILAMPELPLALMGQAIAGFQLLTWNQLGNFIAVVFVLLFVSLTDTIGSLHVLGQQVDRIKPNGDLHRSKQTLLAHSLSTVFGSLIGSVPVIPYLESTLGIFEGGRSGFVAVIVAILYLISTWFAPLFSAIPAFATAPVLIMIGVLMMSCVRFIDWNNLAEAVPAFLVILLMPLTFSVADGLAAGFIADAVIKVALKGGQSVPRSSLILAAISTAYFVLIAFQ